MFVFVVRGPRVEWLCCWRTRYRFWVREFLRVERAPMNARIVLADGLKCQFPRKLKERPVAAGAHR